MSRTLSRLKKEGVIFLEMPLWKRASSCIEWRISWFSLSCGRKLWDTVDSHSGPQGPARVPSGKSSLHASCDGTLRIPLQSLPGSWSSSGVEAGTSGFLSSADIDFGVPLEF